MHSVSLNTLSLQFLCGLPLNEISIPDVNWDLETQEILLNTTVNSDLVLKYPLKTDYQKAFLKLFLNKLEKDSLEIHENLYGAYARLVAVSESKAEYYKHYRIGKSETVISLTENVNLISEGTTGLRTWQASLALAEWCLNNKTLLFHKHILELGSGIGLTGLVASLECQPESFHFSDCHQSVLKNLCENIQLNCQNLYCDVETCPGNKLEVFKRQLQNGVQLSILNLPWEEVDNSVCKELGRIDLILAADVVYDSVLFKPLIGALKNISEECKVEDIVFACTERNPETLKKFLQEISENFNVGEEKCPSQMNFVWTSSPPVRIFRFKLH